MGRAEAKDATAPPRSAGAWAQPARFRHLRLIHPARNRLPRDFIA
jgi:hypothetical protein